MAKIDEDMSLEHIPLVIYNELINELNKNSNWQVLAVCVGEQLGYQW